MTYGRLEEGHLETHPNLIRPTSFGQIPHPLDAIVVALLKYLQETDNQPRRCEHQDLEIDVDWWTCPDLSVCGAGQLGCGSQRGFLTALYSWNP